MMKSLTAKKSYALPLVVVLSLAVVGVGNAGQIIELPFAPPEPVMGAPAGPPRVKALEGMDEAQQRRALAAFQKAGLSAAVLHQRVSQWRRDPASAPRAWQDYFGGPHFPQANASFWIDYERMLESMVKIAYSGAVILKRETACKNPDEIAYVNKPYHYIVGVQDTIHFCPSFFPPGPDSVEDRIDESSNGIRWLRGRWEQVAYSLTEFPDFGKGYKSYFVNSAGMVFHELSHWAGTHDGTGKFHASRYADSNAYSAAHLAILAGFELGY